MQCLECNRGFESRERETALEMARLHARDAGHRLPASFRFTAMEAFTLVVEEHSIPGWNED